MENLTIGSTECVGFGTTNPNAVLTVNGEDYKLATLTLDGLLHVPAFCIDFREANRQRRRAACRTNLPVW